MDAGKVSRQLMYQVARKKNLSSIPTAMFDPYVERLLVGNPLTAPLEEINPMQLTESARRITKMGPGGLGSSDSITEEAQAIHPSQFGYISVIEGPESERAGIDVRVAWGAKLGSNGRLYQKYFDRHSKKMRWLSPEDVSNLTIKIPD
jgi:DNA-directed RNA polymerase beta subunit